MADQLLTPHRPADDTPVKPRNPMDTLTGQVTQVYAWHANHEERIVKLEAKLPGRGLERAALAFIAALLCYSAVLLTILVFR